jgi:Holliday junction resolvase RusA-like endonuclease
LASVEFSIEDFPPAYDSGFSISNKKHRRYPQVVTLQSAAKKAMNGAELLQGDLTIEVKCEATLEHRLTDTINLIGGISNSLERIVYSNDRQIREIHFKRLTSNERDRYTVRIGKVGQY